MSVRAAALLRIGRRTTNISFSDERLKALAPFAPAGSGHWKENSASGTPYFCSFPGQFLSRWPLDYFCGSDARLPRVHCSLLG